MANQVAIVLLPSKLPLFLEYLNEPKQKQLFTLVSQVLASSFPGHPLNGQRLNVLTIEAGESFHFFNLGFNWGEYEKQKGGRAS